MTSLSFRTRSRPVLRTFRRLNLPSSSVLSLSLAIALATTAMAQDDGGERAVTPAAATDAKKDPSTLQRTPFAPGVVRVIPPSPLPDETFDGPLTLQTFLSSYPQIQFGGDTHPEGKPFFDPRSRTLAEMAKQAVLRREIYSFEFAFKPLRQIYLDVPQANGRLARKLIWYMVYRVRYVGGDLRPNIEEVGGVPVYKKIEEIHYDSRRFFPALVLRDQASDKEYLDRVLPTTTARIRNREKITAPVYNTVDITRIPIEYTQADAEGGVWGVATWEDVDPQLDFISVEVYGLTNAFEQDGEGPDSTYRRKVLQLNFFRPGDAVNMTEDTIRFGVPAYQNEREQAYVLKQYGLDERRDYRWVFK